jgi:hypothetical protein
MMSYLLHILYVRGTILELEHNPPAKLEIAEGHTHDYMPVCG